MLVSFYTWGQQRHTDLDAVVYVVFDGRYYLNRLLFV